MTTSLPPEPPQETQQVPVCPRHPDRVSYVRCQRCERPVCPECQRAAPVGVQCVDCVREQARGTRAARTVFGGLASQGRPVVTLTIIGVCVGLFLLQYGTQDEVTARLAFYPPLAIAEPYRFLTAAFLHSTGFLLHIAFNLYALWMVGPYLEGLLGRAQFAALYLLSAVGGSVGYYVLVSPYGENWGVPTVGASGAVFGLFGALFVVNRKLGRDVAGIVAVVAINAVLGFVASGIAWQAHLGGLVTGAVVAALIVHLPGSSRVRWAALGAVAVVLVAVVVVRTQTLPPGAEIESLSTLWKAGVDNTRVIPQL
ncbi:MAG TPA: rhomboid family intramembrane serine protease [Kineosporiaceae bacterium]|nr:rhomboid family intramembrane serine protease [Kineosporiaceae bacterium]